MALRGSSPARQGERPRAEHRIDLAVHCLKTIGCQASGLVSDEDLMKAVRLETRRHGYDEVILATAGPGGSWLARVLHLDPVHQLRHLWGSRLIVCRPSAGQTHPRQCPSPPC